MSNARNILIFGPTGAVGSAAALTAHQEGAQVTFAMRDPTKPIPSLDHISAKRIQADLSDPGSVYAAAIQSGAKVAFLYALFDTSDHMRATIEALKTGGIEFVVLLSSVTVKGNIRAVPTSEYIGYTHAQIEVSLDEVFGRENFVAVRPYFFTSNILWFKDGIVSGEVKHANPDAAFDWISPEDIGRVAGQLLAHGSRENVVYLSGPEQMSLREALVVVSRVLGKEIRATKISRPEAFQLMVANGTPGPLANNVMDDLTEHPGEDLKFTLSINAVDNIQRYTNRVPIRFHEWMEVNKHKFEA
ncbi:hypothetical protein N7492_005905 [Penicillium capsulatum]|uniref:NmrA-like domain-containing protein n=1 Tax=Penicillium capsulatum TaxID=69766 RepID=A0A9W9IGP5_9EURO|nr:hypothetical protein N7492_005905 [Penicillium capsulatum]KAJ6134993.1 hypothetical protein N7512_000153 [Penicillium capsulatum]